MGNGAFAVADVVSGTHPAIVRVTHVADGGWDLQIEREGEPPVREHYSDWHRVERRRALAALPAGPPGPTHHQASASARASRPATTAPGGMGSTCGGLPNLPVRLPDEPGERTNRDDAHAAATSGAAAARIRFA